jgi:DNA helicase-2/ATP-dependent DNA helicase PcrA
MPTEQEDPAGTPPAIGDGKQGGATSEDTEKATGAGCAVAPPTQEPPPDDHERAEYAGRYVVIGPPGTGKTTFLAKQVRAIVDRLGPGDANTSPVLIVSLTKTAAAEVAGRGLPISAQAVGTLHAHCYRALGRPKLATGEALRDWNARHPTMALGEEGGSTLDEAIGELLPGGGPGDQASQRYHLLRQRRIDRELWADDAAEFADEWEAWKESGDFFDFTDLIQTTLDNEVRPPLSPRVIVADEAQDLSALELDLLRAWGDAAGALIVCGDPYQALYTWRGADPGIFTDPAIPAGRRKLLGQSYRVPERPLKVAMHIIAGLTGTAEPITYQPRRHKGRVVQGRVEPSLATWRSPGDAIDQALSGPGSVMIAGACSYLLKPTVAHLREAGIPFANPWRPTRGDWNPISATGTSTIRRVQALLAPHTDASGLWTWSDLWAWVKLCKPGLISHGWKTRIETKATEQPQERPLMLELSPVFKTGEVRELWQTLRGATNEEDAIAAALQFAERHVTAAAERSLRFAAAVFTEGGLAAADAPPRVYVGTIHSFKGGEADTVILFPDLSHAAARAWSGSAPALKDAVTRTFYVGLTRCRDRLILCEPADKSGGNHVDLEAAAEAAGVM